MFGLNKLGAQLLAGLVFVAGIFGYLANRDRKVRKETLAELEKEHTKTVIENMEKASEIEDSNANTSDDSVRDSLRDEWR